MQPKLGAQARAVYAALAEPGTAEDVAERTGLIVKSVGPHCADLVKMTLVEVVDRVPNARGKKVKVFAQAPPERVDPVLAAAGPQAARRQAEAEGKTRRKSVVSFPVADRKRFVYELFKNRDLLQALDEDDATSKAEKRARRRAREELRRREQLDKELLQQEREAQQAQDPRLPYWAAWRKYSQGADAARFLIQLLERDVDLAARGMQPLVEPRRWRESEWHTREMLRVTGALHAALHRVFDFGPSACPACGAPPAEPHEDVVDATVALEGLLSLEAGENSAFTSSQAGGPDDSQASPA
jgi:hypothetical protein